jgi:N-acetylmuramoyl-L-alanine amidase
VSASDTIKLSVSGGGKGGAALQPADLTGRVFVLDPSPVSTGTTDTPMEVQRRVNSLLEASGAQVVVTRSITDPQASAALRASRASQAASVTAVIGLDVFDAGPSGISVTTRKSGDRTPASYLQSLQISQALVKDLNPVHPGVKSSEVPSDTVLGAVRGAGARVRLGSTEQAADVRDFGDPAWADGVARAIYAALASVYGSK